jgi:hypothetical protein
MMAGKHPKLRADVFFRAANTKTLHLIPQGNAALPLVDASRSGARTRSPT